MLTAKSAGPTDDVLERYKRDSDLATQAAAALRISEFDLFRLAYRTWHGEDPNPQRIEKIFAVYLFNQTVPTWLRQFCREVLTKALEGVSLREHFGASNLRYREPLLDISAKSPEARLANEFAFCGLLVLFLVTI